MWRALAAQVNGPRLAAARNALAHLHFLGGAVAIVDHHAAEFDGAAAHAELDLAELFSPFHLDIVVIRGAIYVGGAQQFPAALPLAQAGLWQQEQRHEAAKCNDSSSTHVPPQIDSIAARDFSTSRIRHFPPVASGNGERRGARNTSY